MRATAALRLRAKVGRATPPASAPTVLPNTSASELVFGAHGFGAPGLGGERFGAPILGAQTGAAGRVTVSPRRFNSVCLRLETVAARGGAVRSSSGKSWSVGRGGAVQPTFRHYCILHHISAGPSSANFAFCGKNYPQRASRNLSLSPIAPRWVPPSPGACSSGAARGATRGGEASWTHPGITACSMAPKIEWRSGPVISILTVSPTCRNGVFGAPSLIVSTVRSSAMQL